MSIHTQKNYNIICSIGQLQNIIRLKSKKKKKTRWKLQRAHLKKFKNKMWVREDKQIEGSICHDPTTSYKKHLDNEFGCRNQFFSFDGMNFSIFFFCNLYETTLIYASMLFQVKVTLKFTKSFQFEK